MEGGGEERLSGEEEPVYSPFRRRGEAIRTQRAKLFCVIHGSPVLGESEYLWASHENGRLLTLFCVAFLHSSPSSRSPP
jgi:hypothetical protein